MAQNKKVSNIRDYRRGPLHLNIGMIIFGILFIYMVVSLILYMNNKHIVGYEVTRGSLSVPNVYQISAGYMFSLFCEEIDIARSITGRRNTPFGSGSGRDP